MLDATAHACSQRNRGASRYWGGIDGRFFTNVCLCKSVSLSTWIYLDSYILMLTCLCISLHIASHLLLLGCLLTQCERIEVNEWTCAYSVRLFYWREPTISSPRPTIFLQAKWVSGVEWLWRWKPTPLLWLLPLLPRNACFGVFHRRRVFCSIVHTCITLWKHFHRQ